MSAGTARGFPAGGPRRAATAGRRAGAAEAAVVESRDHRLAGAGGGDDEIPVPIVELTLGGRAPPASLPGSGRADLQPGERMVSPAVSRRARRPQRARRQVDPILVRVVPLEAAVVPVGVEGGSELRHQRRRGHPGQPDVPLHAVQQRCPGQIGRPDVGGVEFRVAAEQPRLGMQSRPQGVVLNFDLGAELPDQPVQRDPLGGAHVGRGHDPQWHAPSSEILEFRLQDPQAVPFDEGAQQVDLIGGDQFGTQLSA